jgi:hypothetical protein
VVDIARLVAVDTGVDDDVLVDDEEERVVVVRVLVVVAPVGFLVRDALARVFDDARALRNLARGEHAAAVHSRAPHSDERRAVDVSGAHTATGALIAG